MDPKDATFPGPAAYAEEDNRQPIGEVSLGKEHVLDVPVSIVHELIAAAWGRARAGRYAAPASRRHGARLVKRAKAGAAKAVPAVIWKRCGHVRDAADTCNVSASKPGGQCRTCWRVAHRAADVRYGNSAHGRYTRETWRAEHPLRVMLYAARYAVKLARARLQRLDAA
jgi:hypothetical protein